MGIAEHIKHIAKQSAGDGMQLCIVKSVDEAKSMCECEPVNGGAPYFARLRALIEVEDKSPLIVPVKDSVVIVATFSKNSAEAFVLGYTEVEKIYFKNSKGGYINIPDGSVVVNGDNYGGIIIVDKLIDELKKVNDLLQGVLSVINGAPVTEPGNGSPSALQLALKGVVAGKALPQYQSITNEKVKHGDK
jgi:hypothetical protein